MKTSIISEIIKEIRRSKKSLSWPDHPAAQAGIVTKEAGELMQVSLQWKYDRASEVGNQNDQIQTMRLEAIQTAAAAIRFIENLPAKAE